MSVERRRVQDFALRLATPKTPYVIARKHGLNMVMPREYWLDNRYDIEPETTKYLKQTLCSGDLFVDAGASIGYYTLLAASMNCKVHAFEPKVENFRILCANVLRNKLSQVAPHDIALSNLDGSQRFYVAKWGKSSLIPRYRTTETRIIPTRRLDIFNLNPNVVKIDVEGHELEVLQGMRETIERSAPAIICEVSPQNGGDIKALFELLDDWKCRALDHNFLFLKEAAE